MTFAQGRYQPDVLPGPQWRPAPLAGIRVAGAGIDGFRLTAVQGAAARCWGRYPSPGGWMSERPPASPDGLGTPVSPPNRA